MVSIAHLRFRFINSEATWYTTDRSYMRWGFLITRRSFWTQDTSVGSWIPCNNVWLLHLSRMLSIEQTYGSPYSSHLEVSRKHFIAKIRHFLQKQEKSDVSLSHPVIKSVDISPIGKCDLKMDSNATQIANVVHQINGRNILVTSTIVSGFQQGNMTWYQLPKLITTGAYCSSGLVFAGIFLGIVILLTFIRRPRLITPFTIYVLNLTAINLITAATYDVMMLLRVLHRERFRGNVAFCGAYKYMQWTTLGACSMQHFIICVDRWLALLRPNWYRTKTVRFGVRMTLAAFVYQQLWYLPMFALDVMQVSLEKCITWDKSIAGMT